MFGKHKYAKAPVYIYKTPTSSIYNFFNSIINEISHSLIEMKWSERVSSKNVKSRAHISEVQRDCWSNEEKDDAFF